MKFNLNLSNRSLEEKVLIILGFLSLLFIFPFAVYRLLQGNLLVAAMEFLHCTILFICSVYIIKTGKVKTVKLIIVVLTITAICFSIYFLGYSQIHWVYPVILITYYLVNHKQAIVLTLCTLVFIIIVTFHQVEFSSFAKTLASLLLTNIFAYIFSKYMYESREKLLTYANQDALTGISNRRALNNKLKEIISIQNRYSIDFCLIIFDLDHFKKINDQYGHDIGDDVLIKVTSHISERLRASDQFYRFGGEEFVIIPGQSNQNESFILAESVRKLVEKIEYEHSFKTTISIGIANFIKDDTPSSWLKRADDALYRSKENGRNQTTIYTNSYTNNL